MHSPKSPGAAHDSYHRTFLWSDVVQDSPALAVALIFRRGPAPVSGSGHPRFYPRRGILFPGRAHVEQGHGGEPALKLGAGGAGVGASINGCRIEGHPRQPARTCPRRGLGRCKAVLHQAGCRTRHRDRVSARASVFLGAVARGRRDQRGARRPANAGHDLYSNGACPHLQSEWGGVHAPVNSHGSLPTQRKRCGRICLVRWGDCLRAACACITARRGLISFAPECRRVTFTA